ncbi:amidohydrolase family protein, partial [bacterium]|nr:amidohydrolase family protein [bacterium]
VAVHSFEGLKEFNLLLEMAESGDLPLKVACSFNLADFDAVIRERLKAGAGKGWVRLSGLKLYADGALGSRSAAVTNAYTDEPDNYGIDVMTDIEMKREATRAADHGLPTAIHAIGDRAVRNALIALVAARKRAPEIKGLRVEHAQLIQRSDLYTFASHDICASIQPCHMISDIEMAERFWSNQTGMLYPYGSLFRTGAKIIFGSDAPIDDENPLKNIRGAITRRRIEGKWSDYSWHSNECMSVVDAFAACTSGPADIEIGPRRGRLEPGMPADLVIFGENPFEKFPDRLHETKIVTVFVDGQRIK